MPSRVTKASVQLGDLVTCRERVQAYYSGYGGLPECYFEPGDVGRAVSLDVPCVTYSYRRSGGTASFVRVEFEKDGHTWSCALYYNNLRRLS